MLCLRLRLQKKRQFWKSPGRTELWWTNLSNGEMPAEEWIHNLRLDFSTFMMLVDSIKSFVAPNPGAKRQDKISAEKRVAIVLYYLKDLGSLRMVANTFGVSKATVSVSLRTVCGAIVKHLGPKLIKFPSSLDEIKVAVSKFESKFQIPCVIGCIDGTHIPIKMPAENHHDYFCYKMKYSLNCQAICNDKGEFIDVEVKWPGSVHDARIYANSKVNSMFTSKQLPPFFQELVPGFTPVPPLLLGDPAYPLLPNVMKEYPSCSNNKELIFNNALRTARNQIECAFGRLKARWRILNRNIDVDIDFAPTLIYSCFVLHNFCEANSVEVNQDMIQTQMSIERRGQCCEHHDKIDKLYSYSSARGKKVRDTIAEYLHEKQ